MPDLKSDAELIQSFVHKWRTGNVDAESFNDFIDRSERLAAAALARSILPTPEVAEAMERLKLMHDGKGRRAYGHKHIEHQIKRDEAAVICHYITALERPMTNEEAEAEYDSAPAIPLSEKDIQETLQYIRDNDDRQYRHPPARGGFDTDINDD